MWTPRCFAHSFRLLALGLLLGLGATGSCNWPKPDPLGEQCSEVAIPRRTITVDGETSDWAGIAPQLTRDPAKPNTTAHRITALSVAADEENVYLRIVIESDKTTTSNPFCSNQICESGEGVGESGPCPSDCVPQLRVALKTSGFRQGQISPRQDGGPPNPWSCQGNWNDNEGGTSINCQATPRGTAGGLEFEFSISRADLGPQVSIYPVLDRWQQFGGPSIIDDEIGCVWTRLEAPAADGGVDAASDGHANDGHANDGQADPCTGVVSGKVCGSGADANIVFDCTDGATSGQTVCDLGSYCTTPTDQAGPRCAQWSALPAPPATSGFVAAANFNGQLLAITADGHLWVSASGVPTSAGDWSEDTAYAAALGPQPPPGAAIYAMASVGPWHLWIVGPGGLLMHKDDQGSWTRLGSGTTENLHSIVASTGSGQLYVWIVGANGTFVSNPSHDGLTFTAETLMAGGSAVTETLNAITLCSPCLAGGSDLGLFHAPDGASWVRDTTTLPPPNASDIIWGMERFDGATTAVAITQSASNSGSVLEASIDDPTAATSWSPVYSTNVGALRGIGKFQQRMVAVGENGAAAIRETTGVWTASPTGIDGHLSAVLEVSGKILAVGSSTTGVPLVVEYIGP